MASDVQQTYFEWKHEQEDSQGPSISQMMDHGSISFGKFAFETLSWEKRSVFTHNERQEELEKFKSPGLVAKKKAYFEEYYKKVRALKAIQNQQTELLLEYGADGSISSQTGDEDEPPFPSTIPNEMPESISEAPLEDLTAEISFEQECSTAFEHEYMAPRFLEDATAKETIEPHSSHCEVKKEENYNNFIQVQISSPLVCSTDPTVSNVVEANFVPVDNPVLEKNKLIGRKPKDGFTSVPLSKGHATSARHLSKSVNKSLPERIKSSLGSKQLLNIIDKAEVYIPLSKKTSNKARSCNKSSFVPSHRSPTEVQNKVATPRPNPLPLSKERKGVIPNNTSELVLRSQSKVSNRSTSRKFNPKGNLRVQGESRETATQNTIKSRALQSKSVGHEEFKKNLDSRCGTVKGRAATEQLRTRSINLPSRNIHDTNRVISYQAGSLSGGDNSKKANASTTRKYEGKGSMINTLRQSGNIKVDTYKKQMISTTEKQQRPNGVSKSFIGGLSPDGRKSRKENPRWR
ncbi:hypothetical protein M5K25_021697 [Dendrobium thyrsiflorum]|uniref:TPX2 C-terminal domain-containing protein n=1 Tax=Dendrobium thyrsiflorum TaxID=117978 RepID=A0ABD0UAE3_DENTH